jgi:hypothetical protein
MHVDPGKDAEAFGREGLGCPVDGLVHAFRDFALEVDAAHSDSFCLEKLNRGVYPSVKAAGMRFGNYGLPGVARPIKLVIGKGGIPCRYNTQSPSRRKSCSNRRWIDCPLCGDYVVLVQAQAECAKRKNCGVDAACPLRTAFVQNDFYRPRPLRLAQFRAEVLSA